MRLGNIIKHISEKNKSGATTNILGVSMDKVFMPSVANTIGTDLTKYNLVRKNRFAFNPMHVGRDRKVPIALYKDDEPAIISPAYFMFELKDDAPVSLEYLELVFKTPYFDHVCWFHTDASVRGGLTWKDFDDIDVSIPSKDEQNKIVHYYKTAKNRISVLESSIDDLTNIAQSIFNNRFGKWCFDIKNKSEDRVIKKLGDLLTLVKKPVKPELAKKMNYLPIEYIPKRKLTTDIFCPSEEANSSLIEFKKGDILIGAMRVYFHRVIISLSDGVTRSTCFVLRPKNDKYKYFALLLCNSDNTIDYASAHSQGTTMPYAVWEDSTELMDFVMPTEPEIDEFNAIISPIFESIYAFDSEIKSLKGILDIIGKKC